MTMRVYIAALVWVLALGFGPGCKSTYNGSAPPFENLFPEEGLPVGWVVRSWANVKDPPPAGALWKVEHGILKGSTPRGTWLVSEREYGDFILEFEWRLGERGNSGCGLRFPMEGDPAFEGLELQMVDFRYYGNEPAAPDTLTGSLYKAVAPSAQAYQPLEWNHYQVTCRGPNVKVVLNGKKSIDLNLDEQTNELERGRPLRDRPRRGHIGFQELSRGGAYVEIRNARIKVFN
jgi:Domain of Unknown Function (DUF1080)